MRELPDSLLFLLKHLLQIPTPTGLEFQIIPFLAWWFRKRGFQIHIQTVEPARFWNLIAWRGNPRWGILVHLDTVPALPPRALYSLQIEENQLFGRGIIDVKGQLAVLMYVIDTLPASVPICLYLVSNEEEEGSGSARISWGPGRPDFVVVLEPSLLTPYAAYGGDAEFILRFHLPEAHGSISRNPWISDVINAWTKGLQTFLQQKLHSGIHVHTLGVRSDNFQRYAHPRNLEIRIDVRLVPEVLPDAVEHALSDYARRLSEEFPEIHVEWKCEEASAGYDLRSHPVLQEPARILAGNPDFSLANTDPYPSWTDAVSLVQKGVPTLIYGMGDLRNAHTSAEHVSTSEIWRMTQRIRALLQYMTARRTHLENCSSEI